MRTEWGVLAWRALGMKSDLDETIESREISETLKIQKADGSIDGDLFRTSRHLLRLAQLGFEGAPTRKASEFILSLQDQGKVYAPGFFRTRAKQVTFPGSPKIRAVGYPLSVFAMYALCRAGHGSDPRLKRALRTFKRLMGDGFYCCSSCTLISANLIGLMPNLRSSEIGRNTLSYIESLQDEGGFHTRPGSKGYESLYFVLHALSHFGGNPKARSMVQRTVPLLKRRQKRDGSFGTSRREEMSYVVANTLHSFGLI
jgi:hypothetical protein